VINKTDKGILLVSSAPGDDRSGTDNAHFAFETA
jgi:hypothetical protein